jgi:hypothetical protein
MQGVKILFQLIVAIFCGICASACDCVAYPLKTSVANTEFIFTGRFIQGQKLWELSAAGKGADILFYKGKIRVDKVLKGNGLKAGDTLILISDYSDCASLYKNDAAYLMFASATDGMYETSYCSYTGILSDKKTKRNLKQARQILRNISL